MFYYSNKFYCSLVYDASLLNVEYVPDVLTHDLNYLALIQFLSDYYCLFSGAKSILLSAFTLVLLLRLVYRLYIACIYTTPVYNESLVFVIFFFIFKLRTLLN